MTELVDLGGTLVISTLLRAGLAVVLAAGASAAPLGQGVALGAEDDRACADIIDGGQLHVAWVS